MALPLDARYSFDAGYVARLVAGDTDTERHFTRYFGDLLTAKLRGRLREPALVADARQETFVRVLTTLRNKGGLSDAGSLGAFVNSVCNNVVFETYRAETRRQREAPDDTVDPPDLDSGVEAGLLLAADRARVRDALLGLPDRDRQLLRWLFFEERSKDAICDTLACSRDHLRVLVHRAKARFREAFKNPGPSRPHPSAGVTFAARESPGEDGGP